MRTKALVSHKSVRVLIYLRGKMALIPQKWLISRNICRNTRIFSPGPIGGSFHFIQLSGASGKSIVWENGLKI
jgi:hypothetical protein